MTELAGPASTSAGDIGCLLLPGMLCTPQLWAGQRDMLAGARFPVTSVPLRAPTIDAMAAAVLGTPFRKLLLIGHSLGGIVAMAAARRAPGRVAGIALISTTARAPRPEQHAFWTTLAARAGSGEFAQITPQTLLPALVSPARLADAGLCQQIIAMADQTGPRAFVSQLAAQHSRIDERPALPGLDCPALVIAARQDRLCPVAVHEEIAALLPAGRLEVLDASGHMSPLERPQQVSAVLRDWLHTALRACKPSVA